MALLMFIEPSDCLQWWFWWTPVSVKEREPFGLKDVRMRAWVARQMREAGESGAGAATLSVAEFLKARDLIAMARSLYLLPCSIALVAVREKWQHFGKNVFLLSVNDHVVSVSQHCNSNTVGIDAIGNLNGSRFSR